MCRTTARESRTLQGDVVFHWEDDTYMNVQKRKSKSCSQMLLVSQAEPGNQKAVATRRV